jgi:transposase
MYPDDAACLAKLMEVNYGGTEIVCPGCGRDTKFHPLIKRRAFVCQLLRSSRLSMRGTIFRKSPTNLTHWFFAMYLMSSTRHGVAAKEIERLRARLSRPARTPGRGPASSGTSRNASRDIG